MQRPLTDAEIALAKSIFQNALNYPKIQIIQGKYSKIGIQNDHIAMSPNGKMYYPDDLYQNDFAQAPTPFKWLFIHELTHVWQHQLGLPVLWHGILMKLQGAYRDGTAYRYRHILHQRHDLSEFNFEQQGNIIADYFTDPKQSADLQRILTRFLHRPHDPQLLPTFFRKRSQ